MEGRKLSFLEWLGLALLFIGLPAAIATVLSFSIPYYLLHNITLANTLSTIIPIIVFVVSVIYFMKYLQSYNLATPFMKRSMKKRYITILPDSGQPIDENFIRSFEADLKFVEDEEYIKQLAMLGMMYLQNAVAYDNKNLYLRAEEYLSKAEEAMKEKNVSFETKILVDNLRSKIEIYNYRFGER